MQPQWQHVNQLVASSDFAIFLFFVTVIFLASLEKKAQFELRVADFEMTTALNIFQPFKPTSWTNLGNTGETSIMGVILIHLGFKCAAWNSYRHLAEQTWQKWNMMFIYMF